jgi:hypothetical protein
MILAPRRALRDLQARVLVLEAGKGDLTQIHGKSELHTSLIANLQEVWKRLGLIDLRIDKVLLRLDRHDGRFDNLEAVTRHVKELHERFDRMEKLLVGDNVSN